MTYACEDCGFIFSRMADVTCCPSCEGGHIRSASEEEQTILRAYLKAQTATTKK